VAARGLSASFLLAIAHEYARLDPLWNVRGLGREFMTRREWKMMSAYASSRFGKVVTNGTLLRRAKGRKDFSPYIQPFSDKAKILHFNGPLKPWIPHRAHALCFSSNGMPRRCAEFWHEASQGSFPEGWRIYLVGERHNRRRPFDDIQVTSGP